MKVGRGAFADTVVALFLEQPREPQIRRDTAATSARCRLVVVARESGLVQVVTRGSQSDFCVHELPYLYMPGGDKLLGWTSE